MNSMTPFRLNFPLTFAEYWNSGNMRVNAFERLPDAKHFPDYYQEIKNPIALDGIRVSPALLSGWSSD